MGITHGPDLCPASCEWGAANWELMPDDVAQMSGNRRPNKRSPPKRAESQNAARDERAELIVVATWLGFVPHADTLSEY